MGLALCCPGTGSSTRGLLGLRRGGWGTSGSRPPERGSAGGAGPAANSDLFVLRWLPGAQAPFLVNILDGRDKNNSLFPPRGIDRQSQELHLWGQASEAQRVQNLEGPSLLLQKGLQEGQELVAVTQGVGAGGKLRTRSLDMSFPFLSAQVATFLRCHCGQNDCGPHTR